MATLHTLQYGKHRITYELDYQNRKTLGVKVFPDTSVKVSAPIGTDLSKIEAKISAKAPWILKQQREFLSYHPLTPPRRFINGETHLYLGRQYRLRIKASDKNEVKLYQGWFHLHKKEGAAAQTVLNDWYKQRAKLHFYQILKAVFPRFHRYKIAHPELVIRTMPKRWGSCTAKGKIILNPELIKVPKPCIQYVIIHELCHLIEHNHNSAFYELQEQILPSWRKWKTLLAYSLV